MGRTDYYSNLNNTTSFSDNPKKDKEGEKLKFVVLADQLKQLTKRITLILGNLQREHRRETICHS